MFKFLDRFANLWGIARAARQENAPKNWLLIDAYSSTQCRPGVPQTYAEALDFLRVNIRAPFVRVDFDNSIIFFDGRLPDRDSVR
jgi:hypothetical protein